MSSNSAFHTVVDSEVLAAARRGEGHAFAALYGQYQRGAYNLALRILGDAAGAEDVVQDVFVRLFDSIRQFRGDAPFGAWLRRMIANATIDELRRRQWLELDDPAVSEGEGPTLGGLAEHQADAWQMLMRLPPRARAVLVLHEVEGYTHKELGAMFAQSESYSKSILARAIRRLQQPAGAAGTEVEDERGGTQSHRA